MPLPHPALLYPALYVRSSRSSLQRARYSADDMALVYLSFHHPAISGNAAQYHGPLFPTPSPSSSQIARLDRALGRPWSAALSSAAPEPRRANVDGSVLRAPRRRLRGDAGECG
jgi:hypothetical protein